MPVETVKRGSAAIPSGANTSTVTGLGLSFVPTGFSATVRKPAAESLNLLAFQFGALTADGFTVELSGTTDTTGYVLNWTLWTDAAIPIDNSDTLALSYTDLMEEVRQFIGYPETMTADQTAEVDRYVQSGLRQFYYPPAVQGVEAAYEWSFLKPTTAITTEAADGAMDLPTDFGRMVGDMHFSPTVYCIPVVIVSEARMQLLLQHSVTTGRPQYASIRYKAEFGNHGQTQEVVFWPIPDAAYALTYRYEAFSGRISATNPSPLGGMRHAELITESCLAIAEQRANDEKGLHTERFISLLAAGIAMDRKGGARFFGQMGGGDVDVVPRRGSSRASYDITYNGVMW